MSHKFVLEDGRLWWIWVFGLVRWPSWSNSQDQFAQIPEAQFPPISSVPVDFVQAQMTYNLFTFVYQYQVIVHYLLAEHIQNISSKHLLCALQAIPSDFVLICRARPQFRVNTQNPNVNFLTQTRCRPWYLIFTPLACWSLGELHQRVVHPWTKLWSPD